MSSSILGAAARQVWAVVRSVDRVLLVGFAAIALGGLLFAKLWESVREDETLTRIDAQVTRWVVTHRGAAIEDLARAVTKLGNPAVVVVLVLVVATLLARSHHRGPATLLVLSTVGTAALTSVIKLVEARPRPPIEIHLVVAHGYSFPSGHAAQAIACYGALAVVALDLVHHAVGRIAAALALLALAFGIGASRVVLGVHWLSDVVAGWAIASAWLAFLATAARLRVLRERRIASPA